MPAYLVSALRDFHSDIDAGPGRTEYANLLASVDFRHSVLMTVNASAGEIFDTWNMRNMTDSVMTIAQHHGIKNLRGLYFRLQILVCQRPQRLAVFQSFRLYMLYHGMQLKTSTIQSQEQVIFRRGASFYF